MNSPGKLHITVAAAPDPDKARVDLSDEVRLSKAALLYGDEVALYSAFSDVVLAAREQTKRTDSELLELVAMEAVRTGADPSLAKAYAQRFENLLRKKHRTRAELIELNKMRARVKRLRKDFESSTHAALARAGGVEFLELADSGRVEVASFGDAMEHLYGGREDSTVEQFLEAVVEVLESRRTFPLFDETTGGLLSPLVAQGLVHPVGATAAGAKEVGLAAGLAVRLPTFDGASVSQILELREALASPLTRFRAALAKLSRQIETAAWDQDFTREVDFVYRTEVAPAVLDIEEAVKRNRLASRLLEAAVRRPAVPAGGSAVGLLLAHATDVAPILTSVLALAAGGGALAADAVREWKASKADIERNQFFFYRELDRRL